MPARGDASSPDEVPEPFWRQGRRRVIEPREGERLFAEGEVAKVAPKDNVYSYLIFTLPTEAEKQNSLTVKSCLAIALVVAALTIKWILLYSVYRAIVLKDVEWRVSILRPKHEPWSMLGKCNDGKSLCDFVNGTYTCAPPTLALLGRWDELDVNKDGVWTRQEAEEMQEPLKCLYVADPVEVFDVMKKFLINRENIIWIHPDVKEGKGIHKSYFTFASGDIIMCGYRTTKMCPNLLERGFFDGPLRTGTSPRVGNTIDSALDYCVTLLEEHGTCERDLPSTYSAWKYQSEEQCWESSFEKIVYKHPTTDDQKSLLEVTYDAPSAYNRGAEDPLFTVFKCLIVGLFLISMYAELREVVMLWNFVWKFPGFDDAPDLLPGSSRKVGKHVLEQTDDETGETIVRIFCISAHHRMAMGLVALMNILSVCFLVVVGVTFLFRDTDWINLVMNSVAMVFIVQIGQLLFTKIIDAHAQEEHSNMTPMYVELGGNRWYNRNIALRDIIGFILVAIVLCCTFISYRETIAIPLSKAVKCTCLSSGPECYEATRFDNKFWDNYWVKDVPEVFDTVEQLRMAGGSTSMAEGADKLELSVPAPASAQAELEFSAPGPAPAQVGTVSLSARRTMEDAMPWSASKRHQVPRRTKVVQRHGQESKRMLNHYPQVAHPQVAHIASKTK